MAVTLMELEETCELKINARFAYGERGRLPDIPSNATVTYQLSLLGIYDAPDLDSLLLSDRIAMGDSKRERGNYLYSREEYSDAINSYSKALKVLDDSNIRHSKEESTTSLQELQDLRLKCFNNLAAAQLKIDAHTAALQSCDNVLKVQPDNVKALFRKGKVLGATGETQEAILVLRKALKLEPEMKIIHQELSRLVGKHQREEESSKEMYRRMMGEMTTLTDKSTNSKNTSMWTKVAISVGAISAAALSVVAYKVFHLA
ncbi:PREDICTED: peptidyl-prolyl cis-trans isomerase FKBP8-like isoform X2 [Priapulus caudatus]|nr:PREDICTED: peptidyl-prolyl cis-trans isomerase FKBP8-like isoform X2 [Priapulus caudatus]